MTTQIVINDLFTKAQKSLDGTVKGRVLDFISKLQQNPDSPGLDLKRPQGAVDPHVRTARVNDFWRAVLFALPESAGFVLVSVKPHDDAYTYAARLRLEVNEATGALELIDQLAIDTATAGGAAGATAGGANGPIDNRVSRSGPTSPPQARGAESALDRESGLSIDSTRPPATAAPGSDSAAPNRDAAASGNDAAAPGGDESTANRAAAEVGATPQSPAAPEQPPHPAAPQLPGLAVADLTRFGVAEDVAGKALAITDPAQFEALCDALPVLQGCALLDLRAGKDPDAVFAELLGDEVPTDIDTSDILAALERTSSKLSFASGIPEELLAAIEGDLAAWRVWLHPQQRRLAMHDGWNGPFRVTGGAGTGKTVTALHRARHLAERSLAEGADQPSVLVATYTRNLAEALSVQLVDLAGERVAAAADVVNLDALAARILSQHQTGRRARPVSSDSDEARQAWDVAAAGTDWSPEFLAAEWLHVVLAQGIIDQAQYLKASRVGRGVALNRAKRVAVWQAIERGVQHLAVSGVMTFEQAASSAADVVARDTSLQYAHAVIDEAQDFHPAHWRLVRALVPEGPDDIFLVGDAHQRIYGRPLVLSRYGIRTQGRSRRLTINYRTSEQILRWTLSVMAGTQVDDLEGETEDLAGARSEFTGPEPLRVAAAGPADEQAQVAAVVRKWIGEGYEAGSIGVLCRSGVDVSAFVAALTAAGVPAVKVDSRDHAGPADAVQVMTMHRAKGLEFRCVVIPRLGASAFPPPGAVVGGDAARAEALAAERSLLYVAGSRAREQLALVYSGEASGLLG